MSNRGALCLVVVLAACTPRADVPPPALDVDEHVGAPLPLDAHFTTSAGQPTELARYFGTGKPGLLTLSYSHCAMLCSVVLRGAADLVRSYGAVPGKDLVLVDVSIDPRETPAEASRVQQTTLERAGHPGAREGWPFLVGDRAAIDRLAKSVGFPYRWDPLTAQYAHPAVLIAVSGRGDVLGYLHGVRFDPREARALFAGAEPAPRATTEKALRCFRLDVVDRRFGGLVGRLFRAGAALVLFALVAFVVVLVRRDRSRA